MKLARTFVAGALAFALGASAALSAPANPPSSPAYQATPPITSPYPAGSTPAAGAATGTTGAVAGSLAAVTGQYNFLCGFDVSAIGGTATVGPVAVAGLVGSTTFNYELASTAGGITYTKTFSPCIPSSAVNTAISVTTTADGTATGVAVNVWGYTSPFSQ